MTNQIGELAELNVVNKLRINHQSVVKASLKQYIWAYFILLIFEGALRKWFLPGLSTPLLMARDPIAIWIVYLSWKNEFIPSSIYIKSIIIIALISIYTACFVGHGNIIVALYGARILLFHFPLIFIIGQVFDREDILKMGTVTLCIAVPMAVLIYLQFKSPQSAWVNRGIGGDMAGAGFAGSGEFLRPPGTFSFTTGVAYFFGWLAPFVFYFWLSKDKIYKWLLIAASVALFAAIPLSISRTLFFDICITAMFSFLVAVRKPEYIGKIIMVVVVIIVVLAALSQTSFFQIATGAFSDRFNSANQNEGGLVKGVIGDRFLGGLLGALSDSGNQPFFGQGIGKGTNVGSQLLYGASVFSVSETPWGQIVGELGPLMGLAVIILRIILTIQMTIASYKKMVTGDFLPWLLLSFGFIIVMQGGWAQPTALGFISMIGGLIMASLKGADTNNLKITKQMKLSL